MARVLRLLACLALVLVACGTGEAGQNSATSSGPVVTDLSEDDPEEWWRANRRVVDEVSSDYIKSLGAITLDVVNLDIIWDASEYVVRAEVVDVEGPFWNQGSGQEWDYPGRGGPLPTLYRDVTLKVTESYRGDLLAGSEVVILARGAGPETPGGLAFKGADFDVGDDIVALLMQRPFRMLEDSIDVIRPTRSPVGILNASVNGDGVVVFVPQLGMMPGTPILENGSIGERYPRGIPEGEIAAITQEFDELVEIPEFFDRVYFPYRNVQ